MATPLPDPDDVTLYHWLFAGQPGIDPYSAASSEVYQDVFGEGTFAGKGLLHVQAMHAVLGGRLPASQILSHDLLEGSMARCAAVTDVTVIEDAPFHADVAASRVHRWTRGDWQLLPILLHAGRWRLRAINRWKMIDNLRRSLVAPMSLAALAFALATDAIAPWATLVLVAFAFSAGPLMGALAGMAPSRDDIARVHFYRQAFADLGRAVASGAWLLAQLLQHASTPPMRSAARSIDSSSAIAICSNGPRPQRLRPQRRPRSARSRAKHWRTPIAALILWIALLAARTEWPVTASLLCLVWALGPVWTWWVSRRARTGAATRSRAPTASTSTTSRATPGACSSAASAPTTATCRPTTCRPSPSEMVAHRTSPTNIGLYLLATACAHRFGWIGTVEMIERIEATLATLAAMERHRGHFLNWYDTRTAEPLTPLYVSTVDSGNLCTHLIALAQACLAACPAPLATTALQRALALSLARIAGAARRWCGGARRSGAGRDPCPARAAGAARERRAHLRRAARRRRRRARRRRYRRRTAAPTPGAAARLGARRPSGDAALGAARRHQRCHRRERDGAPARHRHDLSAPRRRARLRLSLPRSGACSTSAFASPSTSSTAASTTCSPPKRVRTGLWAIAKGDVPAAHWAALGRPFYAVGALAGLRSWSGSMFEYLMPTLILDEPYGSVLHSATLAAVLEHIAFAREHHVPWGISECAYSASDHTLAYQYAPQGVPRLALRRTPADELVIAPYATALAAQVAPHRATTNLRRLEQTHARGRFGFIEALDYSPGRQQGAEGVTRVFTFMAHHQGMSIVALANILLDGVARHWGMADARIESVASLLHERAPREVPPLRAPPASPTAGLLKRPPGMFREIMPGMAAIEPTHLLSNGRYAVALRANGAGVSRWGNVNVSRVARRRSARRLRLVLPPALGSPAAASVAHPASGTRRRRRTTTAASTPTGSPSTPPGRRSRRRRRSGSARRTTSSSAASSCTTTATECSTSS